MELALIKYDQFIFAAEYLHHTKIRDPVKIQALFPHNHEELTPDRIDHFKGQLYEIFNVDNFFLYSIITEP